MIERQDIKNLVFFYGMQNFVKTFI